MRGPRRGCTMHAHSRARARVQRPARLASAHLRLKLAARSRAAALSCLRCAAASAIAARSHARSGGGGLERVRERKPMRHAPVEAGSLAHERKLSGKSELTYVTPAASSARATRRRSDGSPASPHTPTVTLSCDARRGPDVK